MSFKHKSFKSLSYLTLTGLLLSSSAFAMEDPDLEAKRQVKNGCLSCLACFCRATKTATDVLKPVVAQYLKEYQKENPQAAVALSIGFDALRQVSDSATKPGVFTADSQGNLSFNIKVAGSDLQEKAVEFYSAKVAPVVNQAIAQRVGEMTGFSQGQLKEMLGEIIKVRGAVDAKVGESLTILAQKLYAEAADVKSDVVLEGDSTGVFFYPDGKKQIAHHPAVRFIAPDSVKQKWAALEQQLQALQATVTDEVVTPAAVVPQISPTATTTASDVADSKLDD